MNILLVSSKFMPEYSGSGFRAQNLYARLKAKMPELKLTVIACSVTENSCSVYQHEGFEVNRIAGKVFPSPKGGGIIRTLKNYLNFRSEYKLTNDFLSKHQKPDLIHIFGQSYVSAAVLDYAAKNDIPVMTELCNDLKSPFHYIPFPARLSVKGDRLPSKHMFICISEMLRKVCLKSGVSESGIWSRPNPVNEEIFKPVDETKKYELRKKICRFSKDDKLITYVAKYMPRKNHIFLLDVLKQLPPDFKLLLAGPLVEEGFSSEKLLPVFNAVKEKAEKENLLDRVEIQSGFVKNIHEYYQMSDVYAFPTMWEGLGTPMLESVACAVPVVTNRLEGISDVWIKDGFNGFLSSLDAKEYAAKILQASQISRETLLKESDKILAKASTDVIDSEYISLIRKFGRQ